MSSILEDSAGEILGGFKSKLLDKRDWLFCLNPVIYPFTDFESVLENIQRGVFSWNMKLK